MVFTRKFSQFQGPIAPTGADIAVGLHAGVNEQFQPFGGGGASSGVTFIITQAMPVLHVGEWVTIDLAGQYIPAEADNIQDGEVAGVVIAVNGNNYTIQQSGYIQSSQNVFAGLTPGTPYFLSTMNPGQMVAVDATANGEVSRPVFYPDTATSGLVLPYRGLVVSGVSPPGGGGAPNSNIVVVNQSTAGLADGMAVYLNGATYAPANASALATAQAVGFIISLNPPNQFTVQFAGYFANPLQFNMGGIATTAGGVYYLSPAVSGNIQSAMPNITGQIVKPLFICDNTVNKSGYILPQVPLPVATVANTQVVNVTQAGHGFLVGDWLYVQNDTALNRVYAKGSANAIGTANVVGVVISQTPNTFVLQTGGYNVGAVTTDVATGLPVVPGTVYYLSATVGQEGKITSIAPTIAGQFVVRCFECEQNTAISGIYAGYIQDMRPIAVAAAGGGTIRQVVYTQFRANNSYITPAIITDLNTNITLTNAANSVLLTCTISFFSSQTVGNIFVFTRNGAVLAGSKNSTNPGSASGTAFITSGTGAPNIYTLTFSYLDTPGAVGPFTYSVEILSGSTAITLNNSVAGYFAISTFVAQEIG